MIGDVDLDMTTPIAGRRGSYRCAALGQFYGCTVLAVREDGTVDIEIDDAVSPLRLSRRPWWGGNPRACPLRSCTAPGLKGSIE